MKIVTRSIITAAILLFPTSGIRAQACGVQVKTCGETAGYTVAMDAEAKQAVADTLFRAIKKDYVSREVADEIIRRMRERLKKGSYDAIFKGDEFAAALTADLRSASNDPGFLVSIHPTSTGEPAASCGAAYAPPQGAVKNHFGFKTAKRLPGNIGYIEIDDFADPSMTTGAAEASMRFLAGVDAIIFDLRSSRGGFCPMVQKLAGYLVEPGTELHAVYRGRKGDPERITAIAPTAGAFRPSLPVFILTGPTSASAAEAFAYDLKHLGRAVVIGEKTAGAEICSSQIEFAFPAFNLRFQQATSRLVHPVTRSSWQGTGVEPDVQAIAGDALAESHKMALLRLSELAEDPGEKQALAWAGMAVKAEYAKPSLSPDQLAQYAGVYGPRRILLGDDALIYERDGNPASYKLLPLDKDLFGLEGMDIFRLRFDRDSGGEITGITGIRDNGEEISTSKER